MVDELICTIGGQQGEGIESAGDLLSIAVNRLGYYSYSFRQFSSRIKGGHTSVTIRISLRPVRTLLGHSNLLVAFDQETIDLHWPELQSDAIIIADSAYQPYIPAGCSAKVYLEPILEIAKEAGTIRQKNMAAVGAAAAAMGISFMQLEPIVRDVFAKKDEEIIAVNLAALEQGVQHMLQALKSPLFQLTPGDGKQRMLLTGNDAISLGALAAGARIMSAYPITPASDIMEFLALKLPALGGVVVQTEDEIAACNMAIGANYAGVRAFTASSGPGLSLMSEGIGLAAMTETPLVVVDVQRGGPSTGLPTKHEQSDILAMIYGTHGDAAKVVMAPSTAEEAFYDMAEAFNIAEEYQCPVIVLSDLQLSLAKQTVEPLQQEQVTIRRGKYAQDGLAPLKCPDYFPRYSFTEDHISWRAAPGTVNGIHCETGLEHDCFGRPAELSIGRIGQMDKRLRKLTSLVDKFDRPVWQDAPFDDAELLLIGCGGTRGAIEETVARLRCEGLRVNHIQLRLLHPFPQPPVAAELQRAKNVLVIENNATGQLASLIQMHAVRPITFLGKYDGSPFLPFAIYSKCKELS